MECTPALRPLRICVVYSRLPFLMTRGDQPTSAHLLSNIRARGDEVEFFALATGGMQYKLIEYKAYGKAVVATSMANEAINAPSDALIIADDAGEWAARTVELLEDRPRLLKLGQTAREYVVREWTWERQCEKLESAFYSALKRAA